MKLRQAILSDLSSLNDLESRTFSYDSLSPRQFRYLITRPTARVEILETPEKKLVGYSIVLTKKNIFTGNFYAVAVDASCQGQGLGRQLLFSVEKHARLAGLTRLTARTKVSNTPMQHLFESQGWQRMKTLPGYYSDGDNAYLYIKDLLV